MLTYEFRKVLTYADKYSVHVFFGFNSPKEWKVDEGSYSHLIDKCCDVDSPGESKRQLKWGTRATRMQYHMQK